MEALEELALSYDGKDKIIETLETEKQSLSKELDTLQVNKQPHQLITRCSNYDLL